MRLKKLDCVIYLYQEDRSKKNQPRPDGGKPGQPVALLMNTQKKYYCLLPLDKFEYGLSSTLDTVADVDESPKYWKPVAKMTVSGQTVTEFQYTSRIGTYDHSMSYMMKRKGTTIVNSRFATLSSPLVTTALSELLKKMEHVPALGGVPFKKVTVYNVGIPHQLLSTVNVSLETLDEKSLPPLNGWTKVKQSSDIFFGRMNMLDSFLGE